MESDVTGGEVDFIYFGWAGILIKTRGKIIAFDLSNYIMKDHNLSNIKKLDLQLNSHIHYDHFEVPSTLQLYEQTKANVIAEPQVYDELVGKMPEEAGVHRYPSHCHIASPGILCQVTQTAR